MKTKVVLCAIILIIAVLICGCTTTSQQTTVAAAAETPDLVGTWTGTLVGYEYDVGYVDYAGYTMIMNVTEQRDRVFSGEISFTNETGALAWDVAPFAGVIGHDGTSLTLVQNGGGYSTGSVLAPDEMELVYANGNEPFNIAIDALKRS